MFDSLTTTPIQIVNRNISCPAVECILSNILMMMPWQPSSDYKSYNNVLVSNIYHVVLSFSLINFCVFQKDILWFLLRICEVQWMYIYIHSYIYYPYGSSWLVVYQIGYIQPVNTIKITAVAFSAVVFCQLCGDLSPSFQLTPLWCIFCKFVNALWVELALGNGKVHNGMWNGIRCFTFRCAIECEKVLCSLFGVVS